MLLYSFDFLHNFRFVIPFYHTSPMFSILIRQGYSVFAWLPSLVLKTLSFHISLLFRLVPVLLQKKNRRMIALSSIHRFPHLTMGIFSCLTRAIILKHIRKKSFIFALHNFNYIKMIVWNRVLETSIFHISLYFINLKSERKFSCARVPLQTLWCTFLQNPL